MRPSATFTSTNQCCPVPPMAQRNGENHDFFPERFFPFPQTAAANQPNQDGKPTPFINPHQKPSRRPPVYTKHPTAVPFSLPCSHITRNPEPRHNGHVARAPHAPLTGLANGLSPLREHRHQQSRRGYQGSRLQGPGWTFARRRRCWWRRARPRPDIEQDWRPNRARDCFY